MGFVQTTFLTALAAIAIPIVVHLIFRWQTRRVDLGSVRFLSEILRETARRRRVKRWLLLALRCACVALLALLFARPYLLATQTGSSDRFVVLLIDRSASMALQRDGKRLVDVAADRARELIADLGDRADWELGFFDSHVDPVTDAARSLEIPSQIAHGTSYGAAMAWARDLCLKSPHRRREVVVYTDLQRSGLDWTGAAPFPEDVAVNVEDLGRDQVSNAAVVNAAFGEALVRPGQGATAGVTLFNYGPFSINDVPVSLVLSRDRAVHRLQETVSLPPQQAVELEFQIESLAAGLWHGTVELNAEDDLLFDNRRHIAILAADQQRVLLVDGSDQSDPLLAETFYLEKALRLAPPDETYADSPFIPSAIRYREEGRLPALDAFELVVLADVADMSEADAARLADFIRAGGGLLVFTGEGVTAESTASLAKEGLVPGRIAGVARSNDLPWRWQAWDTASPMLAPFADPQHGDLQRLSFTAYTRLEPSASTQVLAEFASGQPALAKHRLGDGAVVWFLSACSRQWSDWPSSRLFLPLVHQMLGDLAGLTGGGPVRAAVLDELEDEKPDSRNAAREPIGRPGVFQRGGHWLVVNVTSRESETDRCTLDEFAKRFQFTPANQPEASGAAAAARQSAGVELRTDEIWHWIVLCLVGIVCLEFFVANRTTG